MNPLSVTVFVYLLLGIESAVRGIYAVPGTDAIGIMPFFVLPGVIFVAMFAPPSFAWWTGLLAGLLLDLLAFHASRVGSEFLVIPGPAALGFLAAAMFTTTIRGMMLKRSILAMVFVCVVGSIVAQCVQVSLLSVHWAMGSDMIGFSPTTTLWYGVRCALLTAIPAVVFAIGSRWLIPILGMTDSSSRRMGR